MAKTVTINIVGRSYEIGCDDGQEDIVRALANQIGERAHTLLQQVGQVGDSKLLLMVALTLAEELAEARKQPAPADNGDARAEPKPQPRDEQAEAALTEGILSLARRLDAIAERLIEH